jgi:hypothetical protein
VAVGGRSGSHCRQRQDSPGNCHHCPEPQSGHAVSGSATMFDGKEKLSGCTRFGTDNVDVRYSVSTLSVLKCVHSEFAIPSLSTLSVLPKRLFEFSMSITNTCRISALLIAPRAGLCWVFIRLTVQRPTFSISTHSRIIFTKVLRSCIELKWNFYVVRL